MEDDQTQDDGSNREFMLKVVDERVKILNSSKSQNASQTDSSQEQTEEFMLKVVDERVKTLDSEELRNMSQTQNYEINQQNLEDSSCEHSREQEKAQKDQETKSLTEDIASEDEPLISITDHDVIEYLKTRGMNNLGFLGSTDLSPSDQIQMLVHRIQDLPTPTDLGDLSKKMKKGELSDQVTTPRALLDRCEQMPARRSSTSGLPGALRVSPAAMRTESLQKPCLSWLSSSIFASAGTIRSSFRSTSNVTTPSMPIDLSTFDRRGRQSVDCESAEVEMIPTGDEEEGMEVGGTRGSSVEISNDVNDYTEATDDLTSLASSSDCPEIDGFHLEAVRVDDIMSVNAEIVKKGYGKLKCITFYLICIVCIAVIFSMAMTQVTEDRKSEFYMQTSAPTYDPDTRFQLLQEFLLDRFDSIYQNSSFGQPGNVFSNLSSPQRQALEWLAFNDTDTASNLFLDNQMNVEHVVQRYVLAVLFFGTGGTTHWIDPFQFLAPGHECNWSPGLKCRNASLPGRITGIDLRANSLQNSIPKELGTLTNLNTLLLSDNDLMGPLHPELAKLTSLLALDVSSNKLEGIIHEEYYLNLRQLESFQIGNNWFTGTVSSNIGLLSNLKQMRWERNHLQGTMPAEFWSRLTNMEDLDFNQEAKPAFTNDIIPTEIGLWSNLTSLKYIGLELVGTIPSELGLLTKLTNLQIASNHFSGTIPSELGLLHKVERMSLSLNGLTGTVPSEFVELSALTRLYLQNTLLTGDVSFLCEAIDNGTLQPMDPMRFDMLEVSGCYCCTCCYY